MKNRRCRIAKHQRVFLLALVLLTALFASACRSGRVTPDGELGPPWNTGGLRSPKEGRVTSGAAAHATEADRESSWKGKGFARPAKPAAAAPSALPPENTALSFDQCVILAAQQAPDLVDSVIDLELAEISADTAFWRRMPSISARFRVSANLTGRYEEYRQTTARLDFGIYGFEPVVSHFNHKAARLLQDIALSTHQMAVEKRGEQIGAALLRLDSLEKVRERQAANVDLAKQLTAFRRASQGAAADRLETAKALHQERAAQAALDKTDASIASLLLSLKLMLGVDLDRQLKVRGESARDVLQSEKASNSLATGDWAEVWEKTLEARITRVTLRLQDYNIMMAWAKYLPTVTMELITANPTSDYATYSSKDDIFARIYFSLPLFDWGERSRGVDSARLQKAKAAQRGKLGRLSFSQQWNNQWLDMKLARANEEFAREKLSVARLEAEKAALEHASGNLPFDSVVSAKTQVINEEIALEEASLQLRINELSAWMLSGKFRKRFFEPRVSVEEAASL